MERILIKQLGEKIGEEVFLKGSLHKVRDLGGVCFGLLRDRSGVAQIITEEKGIDLASLKRESILEIKGEVLENAKALNGYEVKIKELKVLVNVSEDLPMEIDKKIIKAHLEKILDFRPVSLRNLRERAIFNIQNTILRSFREYFYSQDFVEINSSKIIGMATEGGANVFKIDYFGKEAFLAQSPQFYKQIMVGVFERVFETNFVYRAEPSNTARHITEYMSLDMEMGYIDSVVDVIKEEIGFIKLMIRNLQEKNADDLLMFGISLPEISDSLPMINFGEAVKILETNYGRKNDDPNDFDGEDEKNISDWANKELKSDFVFVCNYPSIKRPFYTMSNPDNKEESFGFDLIFKGIEITSGAQREHRYEKLVENMRIKGLNPDHFGDYLMAFKYGLPPHGGFGLGLERLTVRLLNLDNVREACLFPRDMGRVRP